MKLSDLVKHTQKILPKYTGYFSEITNIETLVASDNVCTVTTAEPHNLKEGDLIVIEGAKISNKIVSLTQHHGLGVMVTENPHEVTKNSPLRKGDSTHIVISGANEPSYNGKFLIMDIPNTNTIEFNINIDAPERATGNPEIKEDTYATFNGRQTVSKIINDTTFQYIPSTQVPSTVATGNIRYKKGIRISGDYSVQNAMSAYEEAGRNQLWGFLVLDGANVSKSRVNTTDAISEYTKGSDLYLDLIQDISFFVFIPTTDEYCWTDFVDICQELRPHILKTLHNAKFNSGLADEDCYLSYVGDNPVDTDGRAYMIYQYKFQTTLNIGNEDGVDEDFMPRLKRFRIEEKNNLQNSRYTPKYISEGDLPNENPN